MKRFFAAIIGVSVSLIILSTGVGNSDMVKVLSFFGAPGTCKGIVAQRCEKNLGYVRLSTGELIRKHIQEKTELGLLSQSCVDKGLLVSDELVTKMVLDWLQVTVGQKHPIILDGFPRTREEAAMFLAALKTSIELANVEFNVVNFHLAEELSEEAMITRIASRMVCSNKNCQELYSSLVKIPKVAGFCDLCNSPLIHRIDDDTSVIRERLHIFLSTKDDLLNYYNNSGITVIDFPAPMGNPEEAYPLFVQTLQGYE